MDAALKNLRKKGCEVEPSSFEVAPKKLLCLREQDFCVRSGVSNDFWCP